MPENLALPQRRRFIVGACGAVLTAACPIPRAQPSGPARELLVIGTRFEQIYERQASGEFTGMGVELVQAIAAQLGYAVRFEIYPWKRAQFLLAQGKADILVGPYLSEERLRTMRFSRRPFFQDQMAFYALAGAHQRWNGDYGTLAGKRIVMLNGWVYGKAFDAARGRLQVSVANTVENGLNMLKYRHVDLFATNRRDTEPVVDVMELRGKVESLQPLIDVQNAYFGFPSEARFDALRLAFDKVLEELATRGELQRLAKRFSVSVP
jgi:polar amino acid transport system substrate-binding protein